MPLVWMRVHPRRPPSREVWYKRLIFAIFFCTPPKYGEEGFGYHFVGDASVWLGIVGFLIAVTPLVWPF